jgi:hypothetical protein
MNWDCVARERPLREHTGVGGRVEPEKERARRKQKSKKKRTRGRGKVASGNTRSGRFRAKRRKTFADGTRSWFDRATRDAVATLMRRGLGPSAIATTLGIREDAAKRQSTPYGRRQRLWVHQLGGVSALGARPHRVRRRRPWHSFGTQASTASDDDLERPTAAFLQIPTHRTQRVMHRVQSLGRSPYPGGGDHEPRDA